MAEPRHDEEADGEAGHGEHEAEADAAPTGPAASPSPTQGYTLRLRLRAPARHRPAAAVRDRRPGRRARHGVRRGARPAAPPDHDPPRRRRLPARAPDAGAPTAPGPRGSTLTPGTSRVFADFTPTGGPALVLGTDVQLAGDYRAARRRPSHPHRYRSTATASPLEGDLVRGRGVAADGHRHARRRAGDRPAALPRRLRPPGRAARGRPRLPPRPPGGGRRRSGDPRSWPRSRATAATGCSSTSGTTASCARSGSSLSSGRRTPGRAERRTMTTDIELADQRHDLRRPAPTGSSASSTSSTASSRPSTTRPRRRRSPIPGRVTPQDLVDTVEQAGYGAALPAARRRAAEPASRPGDPLRDRLLGLDRADRPGGRARDGAGLAVRLLAVALADPGRAGRGLGRLAVPPGGLDQPAPRHLDHGHAGLGRHAGGVRLVALRAVPRHRRGAGHDPPVRAHRRAHATAPATSTSRPRRASRRSSSPAATSRPAPSAGPAPRCGRCSSSARRTSRCCATGVEVRIPTDQLAVGDAFVVRPGEKIATDGVVEQGSSAVDASMLTGESVPVEVVGRRRRRRRDRQRRRPAGRPRHPGRLPTPSSRRWRGWSRTPRTARPRCSGSPTGSPASSSRS